MMDAHHSILLSTSGERCSFDGFHPSNDVSRTTSAAKPPTKAVVKSGLGYGLALKDGQQRKKALVSYSITLLLRPTQFFRAAPVWRFGWR